jgi:primosomal protein N'
MKGTSSHQKRCHYCGNWTDGALEHCSYCGHEHDRAYKEEIKKRMERGDPRIPIIKVNKDDALWVKIIKRPVQVFQLIVYAIVAFLVYLTTVFAH